MVYTTVTLRATGLLEELRPSSSTSVSFVHAHADGQLNRLPFHANPVAIPTEIDW